MIRHGAGEGPVAFRAAGCFCLCAEAVLLIQRQRGKPFAGHWGIPTGKIEPGETPEVAVARELEEEVGLRVPAGGLVPLVDYVVDDGGTVFEYAAFVLQLAERPVLRSRVEEVASAHWVPLNAVRKRKVVPFFYNTLKDLEEWRKSGRVNRRAAAEPEVLTARRF